MFAPYAVAWAQLPIQGQSRVQSSAKMSSSREHAAAKPPPPLHIDRAAGPQIDLTTTGFSVTFGGSKDAVGAILLGTPAGLEALTAFLRKIGLASPEIETARRVLSEQSHYEIPDVKVSPTILRQLGESGTPR
jgi:hypothetical protein